MGFSSLLSTPYLGRLCDRIGNHRLLLMGLFYSFLLYFLCGFVGSAVATGLGYRWVFFVTAAIVFGNFVCSLIIFRKSLGVKNIGES